MIFLGVLIRSLKWLEWDEIVSVFEKWAKEVYENFGVLFMSLMGYRVWAPFES